MTTRNAGELRVYGSPAEVARAPATLSSPRARAHSRCAEPFRIARGRNDAKGGLRAPREEPFVRALDWDKVHIYFGDERCVPPDDPQSNYRMAKEAFLDAVKIPSWNVHRIRAEEDPAKAAEWYRDALVAALGNLSRFDLVMLGMGPDGHTASLFPVRRRRRRRRAAAGRACSSSSSAMWRITITPKVINASRTVAFAVEGVAKAAILQAVLEGPRDPIARPSQIVAPSPGRLLWLVDDAATGMLRAK